MPFAAARRMAAILHDPARAARLATVLWIVWAVVVWNVVFDHVIVSAGRRYVAAAELAVLGTPSVPPHFEDIDQWLRPAVTRALWAASASAAAILGIGLLMIRFANIHPGTTSALEANL
jgi:hypothetical protein